MYLFLFLCLILFIYYFFFYLFALSQLLLFSPRYLTCDWLWLCGFLVLGQFVFFSANWFEKSEYRHWGEIVQISNTRAKKKNIYLLYCTKRNGKKPYSKFGHSRSSSRFLFITIRIAPARQPVKIYTQTNKREITLIFIKIKDRINRQHETPPQPKT